MRRRLCVCICMVLTGVLFSSATATPKRVILIRHADKLLQHKPGPALSPKGFVRSIKFALYFEKTFEEPDFMFASAPHKDSGKESSIRQIQTLAPLNNIYAARHPKEGVTLLHPYPSEDYKELAKDLLAHKKFDDKVILICWEHTLLLELIKGLGVQEKVEWEKTDFDTVLILEYKDGKLDTFEKRPHQYNASFDGTWEELYEKIEVPGGSKAG